MKCVDQRKTFISIGWNNSLRVLPMVNHTYVMVLPEAWIRGERPFSWRHDWVFYFTGIGNLAFQLRDFGIKLKGILEMILLFLRFKKRRFISRKFEMRIPPTPSRFSIRFIHTCYTSIKSYIKPIRGYLHHGVGRTVCPHGKIITSRFRGQTKVKEGDRFVQSYISKGYCVIPRLGESPVGSQGNLIFNNPLV